MTTTHTMVMMMMMTTVTAMMLTVVDEFFCHAPGDARRSWSTHQRCCRECKALGRWAIGARSSWRSSSLRGTFWPCSYPTRYLPQQHLLKKRIRFVGFTGNRRGEWTNWELKKTRGSRQNKAGCCRLPPAFGDERTCTSALVNWLDGDLGDWPFTAGKRQHRSGLVSPNLINHHRIVKHQ